MRRYPNSNYVLELEFEDFFKLIEVAREKELKDNQYQLYCSVYPHFTEKSFKTFEQFINQKPKQNMTKTREEIIEEAESIKHLHQSRREEENGII